MPVDADAIAEAQNRGLMPDTLAKADPGAIAEAINRGLLKTFMHPDQGGGTKFSVMPTDKLRAMQQPQSQPQQPQQWAPVNGIPFVRPEANFGNGAGPSVQHPPVSNAKLGPMHWDEGASAYVSNRNPLFTQQIPSVPRNDATETLANMSYPQMIGRSMAGAADVMQSGVAGLQSGTTKLLNKTPLRGYPAGVIGGLAGDVGTVASFLPTLGMAAGSTALGTGSNPYSSGIAQPSSLENFAGGVISSAVDSPIIKPLMRQSNGTPSPDLEGAWRDIKNNPETVGNLIGFGLAPKLMHGGEPASETFERSSSRAPNVQPESPPATSQWRQIGNDTWSKPGGYHVSPQEGGGYELHGPKGVISDGHATPEDAMNATPQPHHSITQPRDDGGRFNGAPQEAVSAEPAPIAVPAIQVFRHGETDIDAQGKMHGQLDTPDAQLNEKGQAQAAKLGENIQAMPEDERPQVIYSSTLGRSTEMANTGAAPSGIPVVPAEWAKAPAIGDLTNTPEKTGHPIIEDFARNKPDEPIGGPTGESFNNYKNRFLSGVEQAEADNPGARIAVSTHSWGEKLLEAWYKAGRPADHSIDLDEMFKKGTDKDEPPSNIKLLNQNDVSEGNRPGKNYIGSMRVERLPEDMQQPEQIQALKDRWQALGLDQKEVITDDDVKQAAKDFNITVDDMRNFTPGTMPDFMNNKTSGAWALAVRNLHNQVFRDHEDAKNDTRFAQDTYDEEGTKESHDKLIDAQVKEANLNKDANLMAEHSKLAEYASRMLHSYDIVSWNERGTGNRELLRNAPDVEQPAQTPVEESTGATKPKNGRTRAAYGSRNKLITTEQYNQDVVPAIKEWLKNSTVNAVIPGVIDPRVLPSLIKAGAYHIEAGARNFADWLPAIKKSLGIDKQIDIADWQRLFVESKAQFSRASSNTNKNIADRVFSEELISSLGNASRAKRFLDDIDKADPTIWSRHIHGKELSSAQRETWVKAWEANVREPSKGAATSEAMKIVQKFVNDGRKAQAVKKVFSRPGTDPVTRSLKSGLRGNLPKFTADMEDAHPGALNRLKTGADLTPEETKTLGDTYLKHVPDKSPAAVTKGQAMLRAAVKSARDNAAKSAREAAGPKEPIWRSNKSVDADTAGYKVTEAKGKDLEPESLTADEMLDRHMAAWLGGKDNATAFRNAVGEDIYAKLSNVETLTDAENSRAVQAFKGLLKDPGDKTDPTKLSKTITAIAKAAREERGLTDAQKLKARERDEAGPKTPTPQVQGPQTAQNAFERLIGNRVPKDAANSIVTALRGDSTGIGKEIERKLMNGEDLSNRESRILGNLIDQNRTISRRESWEVSKRLSQIVRDVKAGRMGYDDPKTYAKKTLEAVHTNARGKLDEAKFGAAMRDLNYIAPHDYKGIANVILKHSANLADNVHQVVLNSLLSALSLIIKVPLAHVLTLTAEEVRRFARNPVSSVQGTTAAFVSHLHAYQDVIGILKHGMLPLELQGKAPLHALGDHLSTEFTVNPRGIFGQRSANVTNAVMRSVMRAHSAYYHLMQTYALERGLYIEAEKIAKDKGLTGDALKQEIADQRAHPTDQMINRARDFAREEVLVNKTKLNPKEWADSKNPYARAAARWLFPISGIPTNSLTRTVETITGVLTSHALAKIYSDVHPEATTEEVTAYQKKVFERGLVGAGLITAGAIIHHNKAMQSTNEQAHNYGTANIGNNQYNIGGMGNVINAMEVGALGDEAVQRYFTNQPMSVSEGATRAMQIVGDNPYARQAKQVTGLMEPGNTFAKVVAGSAAMLTPFYGAMNSIGGMTDPSGSLRNPIVKFGPNKDLRTMENYYLKGFPGAREGMPVLRVGGRTIPQSDIFKSVPLGRVAPYNPSGKAKSGAGKVDSSKL